MLRPRFANLIRCLLFFSFHIFPWPHLFPEPRNLSLSNDLPTGTRDMNCRDRRRLPGSSLPSCGRSSSPPRMRARPEISFLAIWSSKPRTTTQYLVLGSKVGARRCPPGQSTSVRREFALCARGQTQTHTCGEEKSPKGTWCSNGCGKKGQSRQDS